MARMRSGAPLLIIATIGLKNDPAMTEDGKMLLSKFTAIAVSAILAVAVACDQAAEGTPASPDPPLEPITSTPETVATLVSVSASPEPLFGGQTPTPIHYPLQARSQWDDALTSAKVWEELLELGEGVYILHRGRVDEKLHIGVSCEKHVDEARRIVRDALLSLGIPLDEVVVDAQKPMYLSFTPRLDPSRYFCMPPEVVDPVTGVSSPGFGGFYVNISRDGRDVKARDATIYLLEPSQELGEMLVRDEMGNKRFERLEEVRVLKGQYTWEQLLAWREAINADKTKGIGLGQAHLDSRNNRIIVEVRRINIAKWNGWTTGPIEEVLTRLGVPREAVIFVEVD